MKSIIVIAATALLGLIAQAMPTPAQLEKARLIIHELMAEDFAALKSGKKNAGDVGDVAMKLVANAETEVVSVKPTIVNGASMLVSRRPTRQVT